VLQAILQRSAPLRLIAAAPRVRLVWSVAAYCCLAAFVTRLALIGKAFAGNQLALGELPRVVLTGVVYDAITSLYLAAPLAAYLALAPAKLLARPLHRALLRTALTLCAFGLAYLGVVEYFFFDEFNARFNFVAVEYLIYPHEVFVNIWESYPVGRALLACAVPTAIAWRMLGPLTATLGSHADGRREMRVHALVVAIALVAAHQAVNLDTGRTHENRVADEIAANGLSSFFNAALNSRLDYDEFYATLPAAEAAARARGFVAQDNATFIAGAQNPLARRVVYPAPARPLHVIVLLQESLGAEFVGAYGDTRGLTPNIDRIARESVVFTRTYATGTRTVRGMEAVTASFPPVPAESIVKRPDNERMFNWSTVMRDAGYTPTFIYGGYGTFDNMNYFFGNNGYQVIDRTDMPSPKFGNIWGVSDEDLFEHALRVFDRQQASGERIFSVVMSTSNHKPFTFPDGVEGVKPKGGGREAGVRYADHAIGRFMDALRAKPWFDDTAVVIVADHGARVYGKEDFPLRSYEIPFIVYSPRNFKPRRVETVTSQLDVAPTVLGLLRLSHDSAFFGRDVLAAPAGDRPVPLNHNRDVALLTGSRLNELGFRKTSATLDRESRTPHERDEEGIRNAESIFQLAYTLYSRHQYGAH
jgi:phosphoglycerol transferase MdoB-like AlkP superfamily enzyme